jgi:hypothetical protein
MQLMNGFAVKIIGVALLTVVLLCAGTTVGCDASDREVLRGIKHIGIEVEKLPRMAEKLGIKKESLHMEVASRLRQAGISVVSDDELKLNPSTPFLKVSLIIGYSKPTYIYAVVVGLNEKVYLERDPGIISYAMPWWRIIKGEHVGESDVAKDVRVTLEHIMNEFIANYDAAQRDAINPEGERIEQQGVLLEKGNAQEGKKEQ